MKKLIIGENDLQTTYPAIAREWHPTKNAPLQPWECFPKSERTVWWLKECGHEWQAKIKERTTGYGCPYCSGRRVLVGFNDFASRHPEQAAEWHPTKNGEKRPEEFTEFSNAKVWWLCKTCGREWQNTINNRAKGEGCSVCKKRAAGQKLIARAAENGNDFSSQFPDIARQWHPTKNGNRLPQHFAARSNKKAWWQCPVCGHDWQTTITQRANGQGCPKCARAYRTSRPEQAVFFYVRTVFPDAVTSWEPEWLAGSPVDIFIPQLEMAIEYDGGFYHDEDQKPRDTAKAQQLRAHHIQLVRLREEGAVPIEDGSHQIICKKCEEDFSPLKHPLERLFAYISAKYALSIHPDIDFERDGKKLQATLLERIQKDSLAVKRPDLAAQWHPTKNGSRRLESVSYGAHWKAWWLCEKGHEWRAVVKSRSAGRGCPICAGQKVLAGYNDLATMYPDIAGQWNYEKNGKKTPEMYTGRSNQMVWWKGSCGHEWQGIIHQRTVRKVGCPFCSNKRVLVGFNDLATTHPKLAAEWNWAKNQGIAPTDVVAGANRKVWWRCAVCQHEWSAMVTTRAHSGTGCPVCANRVVRIGHNDLASCCPNVAKEWHPSKNETLTPEQVTPGSNKRVWWLCPKCGHEWKTSVIERAKNATGCPLCSKRKKRSV